MASEKFERFVAQVAEGKALEKVAQAAGMSLADAESILSYPSTRLTLEQASGLTFQEITAQRLKEAKPEAADRLIDLGRQNENLAVALKATEYVLDWSEEEEAAKVAKAAQIIAGGGSSGPQTVILVGSEPIRMLEARAEVLGYVGEPEDE